MSFSKSSRLTEEISACRWTSAKIRVFLTFELPPWTYEGSSSSLAPITVQSSIGRLPPPSTPARSAWLVNPCGTSALRPPKRVCNNDKLTYMRYSLCVDVLETPCDYLNAECFAREPNLREEVYSVHKPSSNQWETARSIELILRNSW